MSTERRAIVEQAVAAINDRNAEALECLLHPDFGSGVPLDQRNWQLLRWRGGKLLRGVSYLDERAALAAARRSE